MNTIYMFSDWSSASKMKSCINPRLRISVKEILTSNEDSKFVAGYHISVYDSVTKEVIYAFYVDCHFNDIKDPVVCLDTSDAVDVLNAIGFHCKYTKPIVFMNDESYKVLQSLFDLGYKKVIRECFPSSLRVIGKGRHTNLDEIAIYYNYRDFLFMTPKVEYDIGSLIKSYKEEKEEI